MASKLGEYHVQVILGLRGGRGGNDGEEGFDHAVGEFNRVIDYAATQPNIPLMSVKVTGIARFSLLEKLDAGMKSYSGSLMKRYERVMQDLTDAEKAEWERVGQRMRLIAQEAADQKVGVLVDAGGNLDPGPGGCADDPDDG